MLLIPIIDAPSQVLTCTLANQACRIHVYQKSTGLFCDLYVSDAPIVCGALCRNLTRIVRSAYLGFVGDLLFLDNQGLSDPSSPGLAARFSLIYLEAADVAVYS